MGNMGTLAGMIAEGVTVTAYCASAQCRHSSNLDLGALAVRLGGEYSIQRNHARFLDRLRCGTCGGRCDAIIIGTAHAGEVGRHFEQGKYRYGSGAASY